MGLEHKLVQGLRQKLAITPQVRMGIELLELGRLEVEQYLQEELSKNPALDDLGKEGNEQLSSSTAPGEGEAQAAPLNAKDPAPPEPPTPTQTREAEEPATPPTGEEPRAKMDWEDYLESYSDWRGANTPRGTFDDEDRPSIEATLTKAENLAEHIISQVRLSDVSAKDQEIILHIVGNLDKDGYLCSSFEEIAQLCSCTVQDVERVIEMVRHLDPPGIGSRNLQECLLVQLDHLGLGDGLAAKIVRHHLDKLEKQRFEQIAKVEAVTVEEVYKAVTAIRQLEPRPGRPFGEETVRYMIPDVYVYKLGDEYVITLNEDGLPKLRVSPYYLQLLRNKDVEAAPEKSYLKERLKAAAFLIDSLHRRQRTIYKVTESIVKFQRDFLDRGVEYLKPLVQKEVADDIGVSESTGSRVTTGKFVHTPQGVYELKFFFSSGFRTAEGDVSSSSIKEKIKKLIMAESQDDPISDQQIVDILKRDNINVARRTVAKYREALGIASSARRKKAF